MTTDTTTTPPHHKQLLMGWEWVFQMARQWQHHHLAKQNEDATGRQNNKEMESWGMKGKQGGGGEANEEKAQEMSNNIFWAINKCFFNFVSLFSC